jgi:hypothetical protein
MDLAIKKKVMTTTETDGSTKTDVAYFVESYGQELFIGGELVDVCRLDTVVGKFIVEELREMLRKNGNED